MRTVALKTLSVPNEAINPAISGPKLDIAAIIRVVNKASDWLISLRKFGISISQ